MNEKLTLQYLIEALTKRHQMDPKDADAFVKAFFELIRRALERDKYIKVKGLGTFKRIETDSRGSDEEAIEKAYPMIKKKYLKTYEQDGICDTWEVLANMVYPGGLSGLRKKSKSSYSETGKAKCEWARAESPSAS